MVSAWLNHIIQHLIYLGVSKKDDPEENTSYHDNLAYFARSATSSTIRHGIRFSCPQCWGNSSRNSGVSQNRVPYWRPQEYNRILCGLCSGDIREFKEILTSLTP